LSTKKPKQTGKISGYTTEVDNTANTDTVIFAMF